MVGYSKQRPQCCSWGYMVLSVATVVGMVGAALIILSLQSFFISYKADSEYSDLVREQCRQKQIPYFVVHLWSVMAVVIACSASLAHAVSVVVSAYYVLYCIGSLSRLVRCADYEVQDVAMIKLANNFCITEMGKPDVDTAFELMGYLTQNLLGEMCAFVGMALIHVAFLGFVGFPAGVQQQRRVRSKK